MTKYIVRFTIITIFSFNLIFMEESIFPYKLRIAFVIMAYGILLFQIVKRVFNKR